MMFKRINLWTALIVWSISFLGYLFSMAPTVSYWDCGEFAACAYTMGVPHPPGSPLFLIVGRIFSMLPLSEIGYWLGIAMTDYDIAFRVTLISVVGTAFSVLFLYLISVRMFLQWLPKPEDWFGTLKIVIPSAIGALTFAFTYSQWFNAVESEVYAASIFFTAIVVWLIMVWLEKPDDIHSDAYLLLIAYMVGLAIGVHQLNILALPFIFFIIYAKKFEITLKSFSLFVLTGVLGVFVVYNVFVLWSIEIPGFFDRFGLGTVSVLFLFAILIYLSYYFIRNNNHTGALLIISTLLIFIGYSTYAMVMIRSGMNPNIDQNDPESWKAFLKYLNREQYGESSIMPRVAPFWEYQVKKMFIRYFNWQFIGRPDEYALSVIDHARNAIGWSVDRFQDTEEDRYSFMYKVFSLRGLYGIPFLIGLWGAFYHFARDWKRALATLGLFFATGIAIIIYLNQPDPQPRERDYSYNGAFFAFALWLAPGIYSIIEWIEQKIKNPDLGRKIIFAVYGLILILLPLNMFIYNFRTSSRQANYVAWDYSYNLLNTCEPNAILYTNGDNDTFPLWYLQEVEKIRPDVSIVNLSLVNTEWYINIKKNVQLTYELKNGTLFKAMKVPISYSDRDILGDPNIPNSSIQPQGWKKRSFSVEVPKDVYWKDWTESGNVLPAGWETMPVPKMSFDVEPTLQGRGIRVQDLMILDILFSNKWQRPIYFAITTSPDNYVGLRRYLRMDGLAFRLITVPDQDKSFGKLFENTFNKYKYRNLNDPGIFYDDNVRRLTTNYRSLYLEIANFIRLSKNSGNREKLNLISRVMPGYKSDNERIAAVLDSMEQCMPDSIIPMRDYNIKLTVGQFYSEAGRPEKLREYVREILDRERQYKLDAGAKIRIAGVCQYMLKDYDASIEILKPVVENDPNNPEGLGWYVQALEGKGDQASLSEAKAQLERWLTRNPGDNSARTKLDELTKKMQEKK